MPRKPFWRGACKAAVWEHNLADKTSNEHIEVENIHVNLGDFDFAGDDAVVPFQVEGSTCAVARFSSARASTAF